MKTDTQRTEALLDIAIRAAVEAGRAIIEVYESDEFVIEHKDDDSPLTLADRRAHDIIEGHLKQSGLPVLSEEGGEVPFSVRTGWDRYWLVDPLDGTKEFIKRNGEFTVNIALMVRPESGETAGHTPIAGVVYAPVRDIMYIGVRADGLYGAWKMEKASAGQDREIPDREIPDYEGRGSGKPDFKAPYLSRAVPLPLEGERPFTAIVSRSHNSPESEELLSRLEAKYGSVRRLTSGSSLKFCLMAEGTADIYPRFAPTMEWDTAAGDAVCRAAGCRVTKEDGVTPLAYNKPDLHNPWFIVTGPRADKGPFRPAEQTPDYQ